MLLFVKAHTMQYIKTNAHGCYLTMASRRVADGSACCLLPAAAPTSALCRWAKLVPDEKSGDGAPADFHRLFPWKFPILASRLIPCESDPLLLLVEATVVIRSADDAPPPVVTVRASATYGCPLQRRSTAAVEAARTRRRGHVLSLIVYCSPSPVAGWVVQGGRDRENGTAAPRRLAY